MKNSFPLTRILSILILGALIVVSIWFGSAFASSETFHHRDIAYLEEKQNNAKALSASASAASVLISLLPEDTATPLANQIADIGRDFLIVLSALSAEQYLLTITGWISFCWIFPIALGILVLFVLLRRKLFLQIGVKLVIAGAVLYMLVPVTLRITRLVDGPYEEAVDSSLQQSQEIENAFNYNENGIVMPGMGDGSAVPESETAKDSEAQTEIQTEERVQEQEKKAETEQEKKAETEQEKRAETEQEKRAETEQEKKAEKQEKKQQKKKPKKKRPWYERLWNAITGEDSDAADTITEVPEKVADTVSKIPEKVADTVSKIPEKAADFVSKIPEKLADFVSKIPEKAADFVSKIPEKAADFVSKIPEKVADFVSQFSEKAADTVSQLPGKVAQTASDAAGKVTDTASAAVGKVTDTASAAAGKVTDTASAAAGKVTDTASAAVGKVTDTASAAVGKVIEVGERAGELAAMTPQLPQMAADLLNSLIDAFVLMIVTTCVLPLVVLIGLLWVMSQVLNINPDWEKMTP